MFCVLGQPPGDWALAELEPAGEGKSVSMNTKPRGHVARTRCSTCSDNTALPTRPTGFNHSPHTPLSHKIFFVSFLRKSVFSVLSYVIRYCQLLESRK